MDGYFQKWRIFGGFAKKTALSAAATTQSVFTTKTSNRKFTVQKVKVIVTTGSAGKTWQVLSHTNSTALTPVLDMTTAGVEFEYDLGEKGVELAAGEAIDVSISGAGAAGIVTCSGYWGGTE